MTNHHAATAPTLAQHGDALFFGAYPTRRFRARPYLDQDFITGLPPRVTAWDASKVRAWIEARATETA